VYAFERRHRNVRVRRVTSRWEDSYTRRPAAGGEGPDVALMHVDRIPTNAAHETILPRHDLGLDESEPVWPSGAVRGHR
jgi:multiple sugar transport system substrate-binding protein